MITDLYHLGVSNSISTCAAILYECSCYLGTKAALEVIWSYISKTAPFYLQLDWMPLHEQSLWQLNSAVGPLSLVTALTSLIFHSGFPSFDISCLPGHWREGNIGTPHESSFSLVSNGCSAPPHFWPGSPTICFVFSMPVVILDLFLVSACTFSYRLDSVLSWVVS